MADITQTAANVLINTAYPYVKREGTAGATIVAGDVLYQDASDGNSLKPASHGTAAAARAVGIALVGASDGQVCVYLESGHINPGGTAVVGEVYCVSTNAGKFAPNSDIGIGDFVTVIGVGITASDILINIIVSGIAHA